LDGGEGNENPMIPPEMPTGTAVGQTIVDDESNGKFNDSVRVIGLRRSEVSHINGEECLTFTTVVKGVSHDDFDRATGKGIAELM